MGNPPRLRVRHGTGTVAAACAAVLPALFALALPATAQTPSRSHDGAVVVVAHGSQNDGVGAGSVVAVAGNQIRVLTAKHVATFGPLTVRFDGGIEAQAKIVELIPGRDLALIDASVDPAFASSLHVAPVGRPRAEEQVHVWGSGIDGPALEPGAVEPISAELPDGPARSRYALACRLCHEGDSGGGVFASDGTLVGVFIGYFSLYDGRMSIAELPLDEATIASGGTSETASSTLNIARSNTSTNPAMAPASRLSPSIKALRRVPSIGTDKAPPRRGTPVFFARPSPSRYTDTHVGAARR